ncbi:MAG: S1 RNA-binding domain-containing protein [Leptospiraceae bacterium]|nr:S1 RNA-binding domain-containing protein [Leptospiraceae bacterium]MDW7975226.1 S1 RNA-binding domain-containing protein [Leptospiraceae bacterium]
MKSKQIGQDKLNTEMAKIYLETLEKPKKLDVGEPTYIIVKDTKDSEYVFVESEIGSGVIPRNQLVDSQQKIQVNVEETLLAFYMGNKGGEHYFTTIPVAPYSKIIFEKAKANQIPLKGTIEEVLEQGYFVRIGDELAFCPKSKMPVKASKGMQFLFIVLEKGKENYVVSHSDYLQIQKDQYKKELMEKLKLGSVVFGKITKITKSGATIDLGFGFEAFLPLKEITYKKIETPSEVFKTGEEIRAKVIQIDWKEDKILLSTKELEKNPWLGELPFKVGDIVDAKILNVKKQGILVLLPEKFSGFIPTKELNITKQNDIFKVFQKEQIIKAMITKIDKENQKITLSLKALDAYYEDLEYKKFMQNAKEEEVSLGSILFSEKNST